MKDFFGQPLAIGDYVAFERPHYRCLVLGVVVAFTPKQIRVAWQKRQAPAGYPPYHVSPDGVEWERNYLTPSDCVVKRPSTTV